MRFSLHTSARAGAVAAAALAVGACSPDRLVSVTTPDVATPGSVGSAAALPAVFNSAISEFGVAYQGSSGTEGQVLLGGLLSDEIGSSDTFTQRNQIDSRNIQLDYTNGNNETTFRQLQIARAAAERAAGAYQQYQNYTASQAEAYALAGYTYTFFAEDYCGGVPFSTLNADGTTTPGTPQTTAQILVLAAQRFDSALKVTDSLAKAGTSAASQTSLARIGKARVLVDQGNYAAAAQLVAAVPTTYTYLLTSSTNSARQNNGVWSFNRNQRRYTAIDKEGTTGLPYLSDRDPRVLTVLGNSAAAGSRVGFDGARAFYTIVKYSEQAGPATLASGVEARLIEAEAAFNAGTPDAMINILNALRANTALYTCPTGITLANFTCPATTPVLPALTDPGTDAARLQLLFKERAYWLYVTAHRLGDMRRLARTASTGVSGYAALTGGVEAVFPVGAYTFQLPSFGTQVTLAVPQSEQTVNTNFNVTRDCDVTKP